MNLRTKKTVVRTWKYADVYLSIKAYNKISHNDMRARWLCR